MDLMEISEKEWLSRRRAWRRPGYPANALIHHNHVEFEVGLKW